jgi:hypothetical protein
MCNTWYEINLGEISMVENDITDVTGNCNQNISRENAIDLITEQLELYQYDVSSIELKKPDLVR